MRCVIRLDYLRSRVSARTSACLRASDKSSMSSQVRDGDWDGDCDGDGDGDGDGRGAAPNAVAGGPSSRRPCVPVPVPAPAPAPVPVVAKAAVTTSVKRVRAAVGWGAATAPLRPAPRAVQPCTGNNHVSIASVPCSYRSTHDKLRAATGQTLPHVVITPPRTPKKHIEEGKIACEIVMSGWDIRVGTQGVSLCRARPPEGF